MTTSALIMIILTQGTVLGATIYFFLKVLTTPAKSESDDTLESTPSNSSLSQKGLDGMDNQRPPKTWLAESILVTLFCCLPFGIVGIVNASNVESKYNAGDYLGAHKASENAKKWTEYGFGIGIVILVLNFFLFFFIWSA